MADNHISHRNVRIVSNFNQPCLTFLVHRKCGENLPVKFHDDEEDRNEIDTYACKRKSFLLQGELNHEEIQERVKEGDRGEELLG